MNSPLRQKVFGYYVTASDLNQILQAEKAKMQSFIQLGYQIEKTGYINPFTLLILSEINQTYQKASIELNYRYSYYGRDRGLDIRFFTGCMLKNNSKADFHALAASGRSGREEYLYDGTYFDRFSVFPETILSRQMSLSEGGLVSMVNDSLGFSRWLVSVSFSSSLPESISRIPVKPFVNLLMNDHYFGQASPLYFEAGLKTGIWGLLEVYVPLLVSRNIHSISGPFKDRIRFEIKLDYFKKMNKNVRIGM
jgi:hypothetical protein